MSNNNENKLVPRLRFPEFRDDEKWDTDKIDNLFELQDGYPFASSDFSSIDKGTKQVVRITDINNQNKNVDKVYVSIDRIKKLDIEKYRVTKGDLLLSLTGAAGFNFFIWNSDDAYINQRTMKIYPKNQENKALSIILEPLIHSKINKIGTGQNNNLSKDSLKEIEIKFPKNKKEQQKIAACLSSLDEVITAESKKLEALKEHKKGLLQNLFPQEGETVPKLRFKEFENSGEWVEKKLGEIAEFLKGKGISKGDVDAKGKQPCIRYGELYTHYGEVIKEIKSYTNLNKEDLILSEPNDVIIPSSGETKEDIATASCVKLGGIALGGDLNILRSSLNGDFLAYYLSHGLKKTISKIAQGDAVVHLYATQLKKLTIRVPLKKQEQERIAACLSSLDELIAAQTQKIELLQQHKKGLLQGLFPNINEQNG